MKIQGGKLDTQDTKYLIEYIKETLMPLKKFIDSSPIYPIEMANKLKCRRKTVAEQYDELRLKQS